MGKFLQFDTWSMIHLHKGRTKLDSRENPPIVICYIMVCTAKTKSKWLLAINSAWRVHILQELVYVDRRSNYDHIYCNKLTPKTYLQCLFMEYPSKTQCVWPESRIQGTICQNLSSYWWLCRMSTKKCKNPWKCLWKLFQSSEWFRRGFLLVLHCLHKDTRSQIILLFKVQ